MEKDFTRSLKYVDIPIKNASRTFGETKMQKGVETGQFYYDH